MQRRATWLAGAAPAKLNLGLRIVGRRPDGYHELESLFVPVSVHDEVAVRAEPAAHPSVALSVDGGGDLPADGSNLAYRAAAGFAEAAGLVLSIEIRLRKRIPVSAGLGGGSSDAACVLRLLAGAFPGRLDAAALGQLALGLGADVPFFLDPRPTWVSGIGERLAPVAAVPSLVVVLVNPGEPLSTAAVFRAFDAGQAALTHPGPAPTLAASSDAMASDAAATGDRRVRTAEEAARAAAGRRWESLLPNDLEAAAIELFPSIRELRTRLHEVGAEAVALSGSGPTVFGIFEDETAAELALARDPGFAAAWSGRGETGVGRTALAGGPDPTTGAPIWVHLGRTLGGQADLAS